MEITMTKCGMKPASLLIAAAMWSLVGCGDGGGVTALSPTGEAAPLASPDEIKAVLPAGVTLETPTHRRRDEPQGTVGQELAGMKPTVKNRKLFDAAGKEIVFFKPKSKKSVTADKDYLRMAKKSTVIVLEE
ncbi:MAG: hypothetical protein KGM43_14200 [Planctomycetota bacterium]|nr:hypothetical protein [Planctomycetota bacterium]